MPSRKCTTLKLISRPTRLSANFRYELRLVNFQDLLNNLQFHHDFTFDQQVDLVTALNPDPVVNHWKPHLRFHLEASLLQFISETLFVNDLKHSRSQSSVDSHSRIDNCTGDAIEFHICLEKATVLIPCVLRGFHLVLPPSTFSASAAAACAAASRAVSTRNGEHDT